MSNTPPRIAINLSDSSPASHVDALDAFKRPQLQHHSTDASADAEQQGQDEEPSSIPLDSIKIDRKGKGRAIPEEQEQDIANNYGLTLEHEQEHEHERLEQERAQRQRYNGEYVDVANDEATAEDGVAGEYPPMADDEMEERRVQENLKRWEEAEKQRRRAARDSYRRSSSSFGQNSSVVGDVTRKASKIWQDGARRRSSLRKGAVKLRDESQSPFDDRHKYTGGNNSKDDNSRNSSGNGSFGSNIKNGNSSKPSVDSKNSRHTTLSLHEHQSGRSASPSSPTPLVSQNPFHTPRTGSPTSFTLEDSKQNQLIPFTPITGRRDSNEKGALMEGTSNPPTPAADNRDYEDLDPAYKDRPILQASGSYSLDTFPTQKRTTLPTPKPLDLPREISPPPAQPGRIPSPTLQRSEADILDDEELAQRESQQGRWWTDWLCGCRESGRQGQDQAGRTNPFE